MKNKNQGVTLIALVITIIVLLILAGVSMNVIFSDDNLFEKAQQAKEQTVNSVENEQTQLNLMDNWISGDYVEDIGTTLAQEVNNGTVPIGSYVNYIPDSVDETTTNSLVQELAMYSGTTQNTKNTLEQKNLKWRVFDVVTIDEEECVRLISKSDTSDICLAGAKGYNNGVYLIDKVAKVFYSNSLYSKNVQNLKTEDIQDKMLKVTQKPTYGRFYGDLYYKKYPSIYEQEMYNGVGGTQHGEGLNSGEQVEPITLEYKENKLGITDNLWRQENITESDFKDSNYYEIIRTGSLFWLSNRCVSREDGLKGYCASFDIAMMYNDMSISYDILYFSTGTIQNGRSSGRPIVTLNPTVKLDTTDETKDGTTESTAYEII